MPPQKGKRQHAAAAAAGQPAKFGIQHFFSRHASSQGSLQPPTQPRPVEAAKASQEAKPKTFISPNRPPKAKAPPSSLPEVQHAECTPTVIESPEGGILCQPSENEKQNATSTMHRKRMRLSPMLSQTQEDGDEVVWKASPTAERLNSNSSTVTQDQRFALRPCQANVNERPSSNLQGVCTLVSPCSKISPGIAGKLELWLSSSTAVKDVPYAVQHANKENIATIDTKATNSQKSSSNSFVNKRPSPTPRRKSQIAGGSSKRGLARQAKLGKHRKALLELLDQVQSVITDDKLSGKESPQFRNELERRLAQENAFDISDQEAILATQLDREAPTGSNSSIPENVDGGIQPSDDIAAMFAKFDCQSTMKKDGSVKAKSQNSDIEAAESHFGRVLGHTNCHQARTEKEHQPNIHYLVLEVSDFEFQKETCGALYPEKILRLLDETNAAENIVYLRDEWCFTVVRPGDTVNVIGDFELDGKCVIDHENNLLVVHPDVLVSGSRVGSSFSCARRAVLDERIKSFDISLSALLGTMLHRLFQAALSSEQPSRESLQNRAKDIVVDHIDGLYAIGGDEKEALSKLVDAIPAMLNWLQCYKNPRSSLEPNVDFGMVNGKHQVSVSEVVDIEEMIWSPKYGLKGMIDASVRVRRDGVGSEYLPLEFKTGKATTGQAAMEHRAQVILYTLLMSDRYSDDVNKGILYYLHSNQTQGIAVQHADLTGLMMRRNEHASSLLLASSTQVLPPMLQSSHMCQGCRMVDICSVYHKVQEGGTTETSGLGELFDVLTSHLTQQHAEFLQHWDHLIDLEAQVYQSSQSEMWRMPSCHREEQGRCLSSMIVQPVTHQPLDKDRDGEYVYCFRKSSILNATSSLQDQAFTCGDYVLLSTESGHAAVAGGVIKNISFESLTVSLSHPLRLPGKSSLPDADRILKELWRIDKDDRGSSFAIMRYNMLQLFLKDGARHSRQLIVDLEAPRFESYATLSQDPAAIYVRSVPDLNHDQRSAIGKILATKDYSLILGMPGTGKTSTIVHAVQALIARGSSVLLASYTNSAVDNILLKLKHQEVDFLRVGRPEAVHPELLQHAIGTGVTSVEDLRRKIDQAQVVGATCLGITHALFTNRKFDVCIIDEAGQITLPVCLGPLRYAHTFVLVGDHYQLPPLVKNAEAREKGMSISLFRRLSEAHPQAVSALQSQYRMCSDIMNLSNALIYGDRLRCGSAEIANARLYVNIPQNLPVWTQQVLDSSRRVLFLDTDGICVQEKRPGNMVQNKTEGSVLIKIICALTEGGVEGNSIGVISPYKAQVDYIRRRLGDKGLSEIEVHTIDKYQGRDKDCIVVSFVRARGQRISGSLLTDWHRINVAITRAKKKLIMIGSSKTLSSVPLLKLLINQVAQQGGILRLPEDTLTLL